MAKSPCNYLFLLLLFAFTICSSGSFVGFYYDSRKPNSIAFAAETISTLKLNKINPSQIRVFVEDFRVLDSSLYTNVDVDLYLSDKNSALLNLKSHLLTNLPHVRIKNIILSSTRIKENELHLLLYNLKSVCSLLKSFTLDREVKVSVEFSLSFLDNLSRGNKKNEKELKRIFNFINKIRSFVIIEGELNNVDKSIESMVKRANLAISALSFSNISVVLNIKNSVFSPKELTELSVKISKVFEIIEPSNSNKINHLFVEANSINDLKSKEKTFSFHRELLEGLETTEYVTNNPPTNTLPTNPSPTIITVTPNPIYNTPVTVPPSTADPVPVTNPATVPVPVTNPATVPVPVTNPATVPVPLTNPVSVPVPPTNPATVPVSPTNPATVPVPLTNPVSTPAAVPAPVTNPVTTPTAVPAPVTNPVTTPTTVPPPATNPVNNPVPAVGTPATGNSPRGQSWCVAKNGASQAALQAALDYACGIGGADCSVINQGGSCYNPISLQSHASYAFNSYYQKNPVQTSCDFGGTAMVTTSNPSTGSCVFPSSASSSSTPANTLPTPMPTTTYPAPTPVVTTPPTSVLPPPITQPSAPVVTTPPPYVLSPPITQPSAPVLPSPVIPTPMTQTPPSSGNTVPSYGSPPSVLNSSNPVLGTTVYGDGPPSVNNTSTISLSKRFYPSFGRIVILTLLIAGI